MWVGGGYQQKVRAGEKSEPARARAVSLQAFGQIIDSGDSMTVRRLLVPSILFFGLAAASLSGEPDPSNGDELLAFRARVQKNYEPARCFRTNFAVSLQAPGQGTQSATGLLRADNEKQRMRMIFTEPNLGITLSWITVKDGTAHVSNPRKQGVQHVPLNGFELQSLGTNNIQLPFTLFQDILYGGLPRGIYQDGVKWEKSETGYTARFNQGADGFEYRFNAEGRVERILYQKGATGYTANIVMNGIFYKTIFPEWFAIQTSASGRPSETMKVVFQAVNMEAWCKDEYFPVQ